MRHFDISQRNELKPNRSVFALFCSIMGLRILVRFVVRRT